MNKEVTLDAISKLIDQKLSSFDEKLGHRFVSLESKIDKTFEEQTETIISAIDKVHEDLSAEIRLTNIKLNNTSAEIRKDMKDELGELRAEMNDGFAGVTEKVQFQALPKRTEILEDQMKIVKNKLGLA